MQFLRLQAMASPQHWPQASEIPIFITMQSLPHIDGFGFATHITPQAPAFILLTIGSISFVKSSGSLQAPIMPLALLLALPQLVASGLPHLLDLLAVPP